MKDLDLNDPRQRGFACLKLAHRDIQTAERIAQYIVCNVKAVNDILFDPLMCAAVISYARPFINSQSYGKRPKRYEVFELEEMGELRFRIMAYRNQYVAHSDKDFSKVMIFHRGAEVSWRKGEGKGVLSTPGELIRSRHLTLGLFPRFKELCAYQARRVRLHIDKEKECLFGQLT